MIDTTPEAVERLCVQLLGFEGSDDLGNGDFRVCTEAAALLRHFAAPSPDVDVREAGNIPVGTNKNHAAMDALCKALWPDSMAGAMYTDAEIIAFAANRIAKLKAPVDAERAEWIRQILEDAEEQENLEGDGAASPLRKVANMLLADAREIAAKDADIAQVLLEYHEAAERNYSDFNEITALRASEAALRAERDALMHKLNEYRTTVEFLVQMPSDNRQSAPPSEAAPSPARPDVLAEVRAKIEENSVLAQGMSPRTRVITLRTALAILASVQEMGETP